MIQNEIRVLDNNTIDKIAAGEVVERPVSIVKELIENSIDAGASIITVEIKDGGIRLIRVTDNGSGIDSSQIRNAFLSHATSKINSSEDLNRLETLGFRGEALSSIAAVSRVEVTTRTKDRLEGVHYCIEGGEEKTLESVGAPVGTTFLIRDIFYNTLPRLKFLKTPTTEGNLIADLCEHMALSRPDISFQFINNNQTRFSTSGHGDLKEVIYRIFGKDTAACLRELNAYNDELNFSMTGYLGLPAINRANRSSEIFFVNHRNVKSPLISRAVEEGYVEYLMQHKFPFCVIDLTFDPGTVDVNVHPTKQEVRISNEKEVSGFIVNEVSKCLSERESFDEALNGAPRIHSPMPVSEKIHLPESFEQNRIRSLITDEEESDSNPVSDITGPAFTEEISEDYNASAEQNSDISPDVAFCNAVQRNEYNEIRERYEQESFANDDRVLSKEARRQFKVIGQVFLTYWLIEYNDKLMIMDQHAAHEKVNFERMMSALKNKKEIMSQMLAPPEILSLNNREIQTVKDNREYFADMGFSIDIFGEHEIAIRSVPLDLFGENASDLVGEIITDLLDMKSDKTPDSVRTRIATMACKASVKGNNKMSIPEVETLLDEMLTLDNPYNCPHGRPTLITMSKTELDKRFHRIV